MKIDSLVVGRVLAIALVLFSGVWWMGAFASGGTLSTGMYPYICPGGGVWWQELCQWTNANRTFPGSVVVWFGAILLPALVYMVGVVSAAKLILGYNKYFTKAPLLGKLVGGFIEAAAIIVWPATFLILLAAFLTLSVMGALFDWYSALSLWLDDLVEKL